MSSWQSDHAQMHNLDDRYEELREERISALEEIIAARWPRSVLVKYRLRRRLRAFDQNFAWAGHRFAERQAEAMTHEVRPS